MEADVQLSGFWLQEESSVERNESFGLQSKRLGMEIGTGELQTSLGSCFISHTQGISKIPLLSLESGSAASDISIFQKQIFIHPVVTVYLPYGAL